MSNTYLRPGSTSRRQSWILEGLQAAARMSRLDPFIGTDGNSAIVRMDQMSVSAGNQINFTGIGSITGRMAKGDEVIQGKGEEQRLFSTSLVLQQWRKAISANGIYAAREIGTMRLNDFAQMRDQLANYHIRNRDQGILDCLQGNMKRYATSANGTGNGSAATNGATRGKRFTAFDLDQLADIHNLGVEPQGLDWGGDNSKPLMPIQMRNGPDGAMQEVFVLLVTSNVATMLRKGTDFKRVISQADTRGMRNQTISGMIGNHQGLLIVEVPTAYSAVTVDDQGDTTTYNTAWGRENYGIERAGLRRYDANRRWSGQPSFDNSGEIYDRCILMGGMAVQMGSGLNPKFTTVLGDHENQKEAAITVISNCQKVKLSAETAGDYDEGNVNNIDYGCIAIDVRTKS